MDKNRQNDMEKEKQSLFDTKQEKRGRLGMAFRIMLLLFVGVGILLTIVMPQEKDETFWVEQQLADDDALELHLEYYRVYADGTREPMEVPGRYEAPLGEPFVIEAQLPADFHAGMIAMRSSQQNVRIFVGDELRVDYDTASTRPWGNQTTSRYVICKTGAEDANKLLRIELTSLAVGYSGRINTIYACDRFVFWEYMSSKYGMLAVVSLLICAVGLLTAVCSLILAIGFKHQFNLEYLGWLILMTGCWQLASSELRQWLVPSVSIFSYAEFILLMLAPMPFLLYMNGVQNYRYQKIYDILCYVAIGNFSIQCFLEITNLADFINMLVVSHIILGISIFFVLVTFVIDIRKKHIKEYRPICIGMLGLMGCTLVEVVTIYFSSISFGYILAIGILQFVGFAIYQTVLEVQALESMRRRDRADKIESDNANRAKSQFLANMSHEIRTPINAVLGMNTMILRKSRDLEIISYAEDIQSAGKSLLSLVNDILDFSKIESGKMELVPQDFDFSDLLSDVYRIISVKAKEKDLAFEVLVEENLPGRLYGDDVRIKQILINLLTNAVKYTPAGKVTLEIDRDVNSEPDGEKIALHFSVRDTGIGIKQEDIQRLTEEFVRIEESRNRNIEGTGLGINIVASLLKMMESRLEVSSVYGEGSVFGFELILPVTSKEPMGAFLCTPQESVFENCVYQPGFCIPEARILVVDDNPMNLSVFRSLLVDMQCFVDDADSGYACLEMIQQRTYDIIFMDHMMPELNGVETFRKMKELGDYPNAATPVVILTANAISGAREEYMAEGFVDYLSKPIDIDRLEALIDRLIPENKKKPAERQPVDETAQKNEEKKPELPFIDGVNWDVGFENLHSEELLMTSLECLSQSAELDLSGLMGLYEDMGKEPQKDIMDAFRIKVHSMKSNAATVGAVHVAGLAKYLEYAARDYNLENIDRLMPIFIPEWKKLKAEIDAAFGFGMEAWEDTGKEPVKTELFLTYLEDLSKALADVDIDLADERMLEIKGYAYPLEQKELLVELQAAVTNMDGGYGSEVIEKLKALVMK